MKSIFMPRLVNGPFEDPVLYMRLYGQRNALLFDAGEVRGLTPREIMRITHVFVTHTHIDHFIGFDHLLRIVLGRDRRVRFFGPRGIIRQVRGKLAGYTWNLVEDYSLELEVGEFDGGRLRRRLFTCRRRFRHQEDLGEEECDGLLLDTPLYGVRAAVLDHRTPCLGYALEEKARMNINKDRLEKMGLKVGPWLNKLKVLVAEGKGEEKIDAPLEGGGTLRRGAGELAGEIAAVGRGRRIAYLTDIAYSRANERKVLALARGADIFYCEAAFMERDARRARDKDHLTAAQAGRLAGLAGAGRLEVFHMSPRYQYEEEAVRLEAAESFEKWRKENGGGANEHRQ